MLKKLIDVIRNSKYRFEILDRRGFYNFLSDERYLKKKFKIVMGQSLDLENPKTFNEKLQWLKLNNRKDDYTIMVDKFAVRDYIAQKLGDEYLIPCIGVWYNPEDIDFDKLPEKFVLKCNHNSGVGIFICKDKSTINTGEIKAELKRGLNQNYYYHGREWPYKNVKRMIIAEKYMENNGSGLMDYKFYCFNGEPKYLYVSKGLNDHSTAQISFLTMDWKFAEFCRSDYKPLAELPKKPSKYEEMKEIARNLSKNIPFLRVDLYEVDEKIYFSELTFYPCSGLMPFEPKEWDYTLGELLKLE